MNICEYDVLNNQQRLKKHVEYLISGMEAYSDIGKERKRQEDGVLISSHVNNANFRMIAVADGMGGEYGAYASNTILCNLVNWFQNLPSNYYKEANEINELLLSVFKKTDIEIRSKYCTAGTTLALAIQCFKTTISLNIGDTRIYVKAGNANFCQISTDHNIAWDMYLNGEIPNKDNIRFQKKSNLLTSRLGCEKELLKISRGILGNDDYESIYIFSDGVTDCLSDEQLELLTRQPSNKILSAALNTRSLNNNLGDDYYDTIEGGKDNATIAVLQRIKRG